MMIYVILEWLTCMILVVAQKYNSEFYTASKCRKTFFSEHPRNGRTKSQHLIRYFLCNHHS